MRRFPRCAERDQVAGSGDIAPIGAGSTHRQHGGNPRSVTRIRNIGAPDQQRPATRSIHSRSLAAGALAAIALALLGTASTAHAQTPTTIAGVLRDATTGAGLQGACVAALAVGSPGPPAFSGVNGDGSWNVDPGAAGDYNLAFYTTGSPGTARTRSRERRCPHGSTTSPSTAPTRPRSHRRTRPRRSPQVRTGIVACLAPLRWPRAAPRRTSSCRARSSPSTWSQCRTPVCSSWDRSRSAGRLPTRRATGRSQGSPSLASWWLG